MERLKWTGKVKNAVVLERVGKGRIILELNKKEEKELAGPLAKKEHSAEGCSRRNGKGKKVRDRKYLMIDNFMVNGLNEHAKRKAEKRVEWRRLSFQ